MEGVEEMSRAYKRWTEEVDSMLRAMFTAECSVQEMVSVLNRPKSQVYSRLYNLDLKLSERCIEPNRAEFEQLIRLRTGKEPECPENASS
jgi:hypothetical protein